MNQTLAQALAAARLDPADARALLRHALKCNDAYLIAHAGQVLSDAQAESFAVLAARRSAGEPVAYLMGRREFFSLEFKVTPAVLIPRPESELLVEFALESVAPGQACRVLDLGAGSGCVAISIAKHRPQAHVVAIESSSAALAIASENAQRHSTPNVELVKSDWFAALGGQQFDLIVGNPPYVAADDPHFAQGDLRCEPRAALAAGADGLDCMRLIVASAPQYLERGGWIALEHGHDQSKRVRELLAHAGFMRVFSCADLAGIERISGGQRGGGS